MVIRLKCPECKTAIRSADINIEKAIAKCDECSAVFSFEKELIEDKTASRPEIYLPKGIEMLKLRNELSIDISWRKNNPTTSFLTFFALLWNGILLPVAFFAIISGEFEMLLFMSLHLAVGIGLIYYLMATYLNTTFIVVNDYRLSVAYRPLKIPFLPERDISVSEVRQLFVQKYSSGKTNGQPVYAYALQIVLKNGKQLRLLRGIDNPEQALYVEQEVERFLSIADKPMEEEWES